jgi:hypothetical protein
MLGSASRQAAEKTMLQAFDGRRADEIPWLAQLPDCGCGVADGEHFGLERDVELTPERTPERAGQRTAERTRGGLPD